MYEYLKSLFGTDEDGKPIALTFDQLTEKLEAAKDIKLVNLNDGGYVSKEKLDAKITELTGVKEQLTSANATIQSYKDMDIDGIKRSASDWQTKYETDTKALQDKLAAQERAHREEQFMSGYKFTSKAARDGVLSVFRSKEFKLDGETFVGAKDYMTELMAHEDYKGAFVKDEPNDPKPAPKWSDPKPGDPKRTAKPGLTELMKQKNANPNMEIKFD